MSVQIRELKVTSEIKSKVMLRRIFVVCSGLASIASAAADDALAEAVTIRIRSIRAETAAHGGEADAAKVINCARSLNDIDGKLRKLPFLSFSLVSSRSETIELMKKETLFLSGGNELTIRPLYVEKGKVGLWLRWIDSAGAKVLDTRMHLATGESMVAGADAGDDAATVLAIDVNPADPGVSPVAQAAEARP